MNEEQNLYEQRKCILHCILLVSKLLHHTLKVDQMNGKQNLLQKIALGLRKGPIGWHFLQNNNEWEQIVPASIYTSLLFAFCGRCSPKIPERIDRATFRTNRGEVAWGDCAKKTFIFLLSPHQLHIIIKWDFSHAFHCKIFVCEIFRVISENNFEHLLASAVQLIVSKNIFLASLWDTLSCEILLHGPKLSNCVIEWN